MCLGNTKWHTKISSIRPFSETTFSVHGGAGAYLQRSTGERRGTPWTGPQSIAGQHRDTQDKQPCTHKYTLMSNLESLVLDCGTKPEYPERTHALMGRTGKLHAKRPQADS
ncbi:hypothetical protein AMECASPLE_026962 [Ameca splendens]|uniref:Uncharacterized protein n=1 Tax=Ameca splendens TaxID=208324 RepID=A0ABV1A1I3_9TELE